METSKQQFKLKTKRITLLHFCPEHPQCIRMLFGNSSINNILISKIISITYKVYLNYIFSSVQFSCLSCLTLCYPMDCSTPGFPVHRQLPESTQTHVYWVGDAIQPSHLLSSPSPPTFNLSQHQGLFKWVSSSHQVAEVLEFQLQHQSFQCV